MRDRDSQWQGRSRRWLSRIVATLLLASASPACGKSKTDEPPEHEPDAGDGGTSGSGGTAGAAAGGKGGATVGGRGGGDSGAGAASTTGGAPGTGGTDDPGGNGSSGGASGEGSGGATTGGAGGSGAGSGPTAGAGGARAGSGGTAGIGGGGVGGCGLECHPFNQTILAPCLVDTDQRTCQSKSGACPPPNAEDPALSGAAVYDRTVVMPGTPGVLYDVRVHVQGLTEARDYKDGADQASDGSQIPADGFYVGGTPTSANNYFVYMIRVASPARDYFLNSIGTAGETRVRHATFAVDYEATVRVEGGAPVTFHVSDSNCSMIKNCVDYTDSRCTPNTFTNLAPTTLAAIGGQPYNGQFLGVTVLSVSVVQ